MKPKLTREQALKLAQKHNIPIPTQEDKFAQGLIGVPTGIASMFDIPGELYNLSATGIEKVGQKLGYNPELPRINPNATLAARKITNMIAGEPQTEMGRKARAGGELLGGFIGPAGTGVNPARAVSATKSAVGKTGQVLTGFKPEQYEKFAEAGIKPTVADVTKSRPIKRFQNVLSETPFAAGIMETKGERRAANIESKFADYLIDAKTVEEAGDLVQKGASKYNEKAREISSKLYDKAWKGVKNEDMVPMSQTHAAINEYFYAISPQAQEKLLNSPIGKELLELSNAIESNGGALPFYDVKKVFQKDLKKTVKDWKGVADEDQGAIKNILGIMDKEQRAFTMSVNPEASKDFARADKFWKEFSERNRKITNKQIGIESPVSSFESISNSLKRGDIKPAKVIMQKLPEAERAELTSTFIFEMGREGERFSPEKWAKNFNKLRPESKAVMLSGLDKSHVKKLDAIAEAMELSKNTKFFGNPSGTEYTRSLMATLMSIPKFALQSVGGSVAAKMMTSSKFIDAMYAASKVKTPEAMQKVMTKFGSILLREQALEQPKEEKPKLTREKALQLLQQSQ